MGTGKVINTIKMPRCTKCGAWLTVEKAKRESMVRKCGYEPDNALPNILAVCPYLHEMILRLRVDRVDEKQKAVIH